VITNIRAGVLVLAGMTAMLAGSLASSDRIAEAVGGEEPAKRFPPLVSLRGDGWEALAHSAARARVPRAHFPVRGEFNWGQGGARFGASRSGHSHEGQDVFARTGTPLVAIRDGVVLENGNDGGRGNYVAVYAPSADQTYVYLHMNAPARVRAGQRLRGGQRLGAVGCTGSCFGDHLHFEVRRGRAVDGRPVDPYPLLRRWAARDRTQASLPPGQS
jgi:murein DD-endopeptidase MepM/ murein hydrolase activator NlpD